MVPEQRSATDDMAGDAAASRPIKDDELEVDAR
jgi:hypothetical protein